MNTTQTQPQVTAASSDRRSRATREEGFSLIELIVVITIIGILATAVVLNVSGADDDSRRARVLSDFTTFSSACTMYKSNHKEWPQSFEDLLTPPDGGDSLLDQMQTAPQDPWTDEPYIWEFDDRGRPVFVSYGADKAEGGEGANADIRSDNMRGGG